MTLFTPLSVSAPGPARSGVLPLGRVIKLVLPSILAIALFTVALFAIILPALERNIMERKREMITELTRTAVNTLAFYHRQEESGRMTREQAQAAAKAQLRAQRFGADMKDYFWINDLAPVMVMHPYRPDLEGKDVSDFQDPHGKRLFMEMVREVKSHGQGYVDYMWQWKDDPAHIVPKVSFVQEFAPWGWIVGTGIYVQDVAHEIAAMTSRLTLVALGILVIIFLLEAYMVHQNLAAATRRRQAEEDLRRSQGMLRLVMDNIPQLIFWKDQTGAYLGCNQSFARQAGLDDPAEVKGRTQIDWTWQPQETGPMRVREQKVMQGGQPELHLIEPLTGPDGSPRWLDASRIPMKDRDGRVVGVLCAYEDISERRETEQALADSERRFRELVENSLVGILILQHGRVVYMNPEQRRLLGELPEGYPLAEFPDAPDEERAKLARLAGPPPAGGWDTLEMELRFHALGRGAAGDLRWVHCRARGISHQGREALLVIMADITKAKELEHLLRMQDKMASLGRVAAGMAHEIRNPLSGINMYLSALTSGGPEAGSPERREQILAKIGAASSKIEAIIKRVQDFARPGARELSWLSVNQVVESACELSAVTLRKTGISLETDLAPGLPACHADRQLLEQALMNLISNAVQALAGWEGDRKIGIRSALDREQVVIEVADSGPGVPPEIRDRIFDPFFTIKKDGSGIGLSICHRIISDHGGSLRVDTSQWGGALFTIRIPTTTYWGYDSHG